MRVIAELPYAPECDFVCGDADHDSQPEFYAVRSSDWRGYALEHIGANRFDTTFILPDCPLFWDIGDPDRDGRTDLIVQFSGAVYGTYESLDSASLPARRTWSDSLRYGSLAYTCLTDLDLDSACEIMVRDDIDKRIRVYENVADDSYALKTCIVPPPGRGPRAIAGLPDLDRDGKPELAHGTAMGGQVRFYEAVADDSFECIAISSALEPYPYVMDIMAAPDMDRDGRSEAIALAMSDDFGVMVAVYESPCNDSFAAVWSFQCSGGYLCGRIAVGDLDGDSIPEFAITDGINVRLFRCTGPNQYEQFWQTPNYSTEVAIYDINADGKNELLYCYDWDITVIRQYVSLGVEELRQRELEQVLVSPSAVAGGKGVRISGLGVGVKVEVVDACGRVVAALVERRNGEAVWHTGSVQPGVYFIRASLGAQSVTRKVIVLR